MPVLVSSKLPEDIHANLQNVSAQEEYRSDIPFAIIYRELITWLESHLQAMITELNDQQGPEIDDFIIAIYNNDNNNLHHTFEQIKHIPMSRRPVGKRTEGAISHWLADTETTDKRGYKSPGDTNTNFGRFSTMVADDYKPQLETNLPTRRRYDYSHNNSAIEVRISTQGERHEGDERVNPLFELFLIAQRNKRRRNGVESPSDITHIYFNNLGLDRSKTDYEGSKERRLSRMLHTLEDRHDNVAVITLPADKGLMSRYHYAKTSPDLLCSSVYHQLKNIASANNQVLSRVQDFYISDRLRKDILPADVLQRLLWNSFDAMGITNTEQKISMAQRQAIWVHFVKFELPEHIINTLGPDYYNFSCKDAIDRGGIASAYFNLMRSIKQNQPMSREAFECTLHAAPAMVKGRGINSHLNVIWNAVDAYIGANFNFVNNTADIRWMLRWRDANCPHSRSEDLLCRRIPQVRDSLSQHKGPGVDKGLHILGQIETQLAQGVSGKRLLLETVSVLDDLIMAPDTDKYGEFESLANDLDIKYPTLQVIAGLMKTFLAAIALIPTLGYSRNWMIAGWATTKAAIHVSTRRSLQHDMRGPDHMAAGLKDLDIDSSDEDGASFTR